MSKTSKKLRAVLVDDEQTARITLRRMLSKYCPSVTIIAEEGDAFTAVKSIKRLKPDLVFLDIRLGPHHTGFDLLELLSEHNFHLVFATAYDEYAIKAFEVNAVDYLLKPIDPDRLQTVVTRCHSLAPLTSQVRRLNGSQALLKGAQLAQIVVSNDKGHHFIELNDLIRISSDQGLLHFWQQSKNAITAVKNIGNFEKLLPQQTFFRCHQSHLVNRGWISSYLFRDGGTIQMKDGTQVPVARSRREAFNNWLKKTS